MIGLPRPDPAQPDAYPLGSVVTDRWAPPSRPVVLALVVLVVAVLVALVAGCGTVSTPEPTRQQREDQFWAAYERRTGLVGTDYADPAEARSGSIKFGWFLCGELDQGVDRNVLIADMTGRYASREKATVQLDAATEFLCPQHAA